MEVPNTQEDSKTESSSETDEESSQEQSAAILDDVVGELHEMTKDKSNRPGSPEAQDQMPLDHQKIEVQTVIQDKNPSIEPDKDMITASELKIQEDDRDKSVNQDITSQLELMPNDNPDQTDKEDLLILKAKNNRSSSMSAQH
jgi:hypothetical protein